MLPSLSQKLEIVANAAIVVVSCLLAVVLVKSYLLPDRVDSSKLKNTAPAISSLDIDWGKSEQTVLLAISSSCRYCSESAPFYKTLAQRKDKIRLIAVFPQSVAEGQKYLEELGVYVDEVRQSPLDKLGVSGTPTLIVVDSSGNVRSFWTGMLSPQQETAVLTDLMKTRSLN